MNIEEDRFKREREIAEAWAKAGYDVSRLKRENEQLKTDLTANRSVPDDYEIMLISLQANLVAVRDQRDDANAQLLRANETLARLTNRNIELRLEVEAARAERDKRVTVEQVKRWLMRGMDVTAYSAGMIVYDPEYGILAYLASAKEPSPPEPPDPYAGDDVEIHIDIRKEDAS